MDSSRRLIVNADDFGFTPGVTRGILAAHDAGVVTSTSMMVNTPGFADAVAHAGRRGEALGVGLHLNLTVGAPVAPAARVASLVDRRTGNFHTLAGLTLRVLTGRIRPAEVECETLAQIDRLVAHGIRPTHLDGHRHVQALPGFRPPIARAAVARAIRWVRAPLEPFGFRPGDLPGTLRKALIALAWRDAPGHPPDVGRPQRFLGVSISGGPGFHAGLLEALDHLCDGVTELMVHPGYADAPLEEWDTYLEQREAELAVLLSAELRERLRRGDLRLTHFGRL